MKKCKCGNDMENWMTICKACFAQGMPKEETKKEPVQKTIEITEEDKKWDKIRDISIRQTIVNGLCNVMSNMDIAMEDKMKIFYGEADKLFKWIKNGSR